MKIFKIASLCLATTVFLGSSIFAAGLGNTKMNSKIMNKATQSTSKERIVGAPSQVVWTFMAATKGNYKIKFSYARPWEKGIAPIKKVEYTVAVTDDNKVSSTALIKAGVVNKVSKGQKFEVSLEENASTGYLWTYNVNSKEVKLLTKKYSQRDNSSAKEKNAETLKKDTTIEKNIQMVGVPYDREWTFQAKEKGTYTIKYSYARPWEKDIAPAKTVEYTIVVSDDKKDATPIALKENENNNVNIGQKFFVTLEWNPSTGYSWSFSYDNKALKLLDRKDTEMKKTDMVGVPSNVTWRFQGNEKGTNKIKFSYARPWEKNEKPADIKEYTVEIIDGKNENSTYELKPGVVNKVTKGQEFIVTLEENASTGYSWSYSIDGNAISLATE